jgi:hypothetical protein
MSDLNNIILGKDGFVFDSRSGNTYHTNEVGNLIISFLQSGKVIEDIARAVSETYSLDQNEALIDVLEFKNHLTIVGLLK